MPSSLILASAPIRTSCEGGGVRLPGVRPGVARADEEERGPVVVSAPHDGIDVHRRRVGRLDADPGGGSDRGKRGVQADLDAVGAQVHGLEMQEPVAGPDGDRPRCRHARVPPVLLHGREFRIALRGPQGLFRAPSPVSECAMSPPAIPSPAATLVLLRDRAAGPAEILMIQRHGKSKFAAGDYVFAGGKVEADDIPDDVERFVRGLSPEEASARLGGDLAPRKALGYWVGAIREAFEEVGILLAYDRDGELVRFTATNRERFEAHRTACQSANPAFFTMLRVEGLTLATDRLTYIAHWITPEEQPLRFDTRFFAAVAPAQEPV